MFVRARLHASHIGQPSLLSRLRAALSLHHSRQHLLDLDPHMLRDIGLTAAQARNEALRPVWDAPAIWRQG
jgi:uncharacterized protein YjiS (DUF1127 family)